MSTAGDENPAARLRLDSVRRSATADSLHGRSVRPRPRALSLIELLVVVGIIAVLMGILFTTFGLVIKTLHSFR